MGATQISYTVLQSHMQKFPGLRYCKPVLYLSSLTTGPSIDVGNYRSKRLLVCYKVCSASEVVHAFSSVQPFLDSLKSFSEKGKSGGFPESDW